MEHWTIGGISALPGEKKQALLGPALAGCAMPATLINGHAPGKTVLVTAAIHGDEYPGVAAVIRLAGEICPQETAGRILLLHCVNTAGFWEKTRVVPQDGANLNGNYPGDPGGALGARIADYFIREIFPQIDFIIDLHSGSPMEPLTPCLFFPTAGSEAVRRMSLAAAHVTDIPHLIASQATSGHYSYAAATLGIPGLLLERGHSGRCHERWVEAVRRDVRRLLDHLQVYPSADTGGVCRKTVWNRAVYLEAKQDGLWYPAVTQGCPLKRGALLGTLRDFWGNTLAEYRAEADGRVFYYTAALSIKQGDGLVAYGLDAYAE